MQERRGFWARWKRVAHRAAQVQSNVLLFILYFLVFLPIALLRAPFSDPVGIKRSRSTGWRRRPARKADLESAQRQF